MREVSGQSYQHANVRPVAKATGGDFPFRTHKSINRKHSIGSDATYNFQGQRDGFVFGQEEAELSIEMKFSEWQAWRAWLVANSGGLGVAQCIFDMPIAYGNNINALIPITAQGCHVTEEASESSRDGGELMVTVPIFVTTFDYGSLGAFIVYE